MIPNARKVLVFGLLFVPLFLVFLALYFVVLPVYEPMVLATANSVTRQMSPPTHVEPLEQGGWQAMIFTPERGLHPLRAWYKSTADLIFLSLVTLPALLLATPAPFLRRLGLLAIGLPLMFGGHVVSVILLMRGTQCLQEAPGTFACLWALRVSYSSGQLFAAVFWVLLTWRYWFAGDGPPAVATTGKTNS